MNEMAKMFGGEEGIVAAVGMSSSHTIRGIVDLFLLRYRRHSPTPKEDHESRLQRYPAAHVPHVVSRHRNEGMHKQRVC